MSPPDTSPDDEMALSQLWAYGAGVLAVAGNDTTRKTFGELGSAALAAHRQAKAEAVAAYRKELVEGLRGLPTAPDVLRVGPLVEVRRVLALIEKVTP